MSQNTLYRYTSYRALNVDFLRKISEKANEIEVGWSDGKFIFSIDNYGEYTYYPDRGSENILGTHIDLHGYTFTEFLDLCSKCEYFVIQTKSSSSKLSTIFENIEAIGYVDYPQTITDLEDLKFVSVKQSTNFLRVDERKFRFKKKSFELIPSLREYQDFYEVDSLGTYFFEELSEKIIELWIHKNN